MSDFFAAPLSVARQAPLSMRFPRQEYRSGLTFPSPGDHPKPGREPRSPALWADSLPSEPPRQPLKILDSVIERDLLLGALMVMIGQGWQPAGEAAIDKLSATLS